MIRVIKKTGVVVDFDANKIVNAVSKSAERVMVKLTEDDYKSIITEVKKLISEYGLNEISVSKMHDIVEKALTKVNKEVANSYIEYRNYKKDFVNMLDEVYSKSQKIMYLGDKDNSNTDSALVTTKRSLIYGELNKELNNKFFLTKEEQQASKDGFIYIHDKAARRDTMNCCLYNTKEVMTGGFEMGNLWYNEPRTVDVACDVLGDIIMSAASSQYGGWSTRVDDLLAPYVEKSYEIYKKEFESYGVFKQDKIEEIAEQKVRRDLEQGIQGLEYKLNSVSSSRGDYPFTTFAFGLDKSKFGKMVSEAILTVRMNGQGKEGFKRPVLFPKLVFLYDENLHGEGGELVDLFDLASECSPNCMYPDFLSLSGEGYVPSMYKKYGEVVYPMG